MALQRRAFLIWRGNIGLPEENVSRSLVDGVLTYTAQGILFTALSAFTDCAAFEKVYLFHDIVDDTIPGGKVNVDIKGKVYFRDPDTLKIKNFTFPAPKLIYWVNTPAGVRLTDASVIAIVGFINTATGKSYEPLYGTVYQRS